MNWPESLALAVVQGLTEFLPVSSSGHLVLTQALFGIFTDNPLPFFVALHLATALAAVLFYRNDLLQIISGLITRQPGNVDQGRNTPRILLLILVATAPTGAIGFLLKGLVEKIVTTPTAVAPSLFVTGGLLFLASLPAANRYSLSESPWWKALLIGAAQGLAVLPGISRSGATIAVGLFLGLKREEAVRFSFLCSIPIIPAAALLELGDLSSVPAGHLIHYIGGFAVALATGYLSIYLVLRYTTRGKLWWFGAYCWAVAAIAAGAGRLT